MEETKLIGLDLSVASPEVIEILLEFSGEPEVFKEVLESNRNRPDILRLLAQQSALPIEIKEDIEKLLNLPAKSMELPHPSGAEARKETLLQRIQHLTVGEKIALALRGGQEIRSILLKDPNKEVVLSVLKNPKMTETEVEMLAHSRNAPEDALRAICRNREWTKNYNIIFALVNNPKTPPGLSVPFVTSLRTKDLVILEKNKNVPEAVRAAARRLVQSRKVS
ncbi:MAG: hypothetical protein ACK4Z9_08320 [Thermodesulfovibrionales bacterium]